MDSRKINGSTIFIAFCVINAIFLPSLEGFDHTSLISGVIILATLCLSLFLKMRTSAINRLMYLGFALSIVIPTLFIHPVLIVMVGKYLVMMVSLFWLYHNTNAGIMGIRNIKVLIYASFVILILNQFVSIVFSLGEIHLNAGLLFSHRYYGFLGDSVSVYLFFLWKYFDLVKRRKVLKLTTVILALSMGTKIVIALIAFDLISERFRKGHIYFLVPIMGLLIYLALSQELINLELFKYSMNTRLYSNTWAFETFLINPIGGVGFNQSIIFIALENFYKLAEDGATFKIVMVDNTLLRLMSENGFFGLSIYIFALIILMKNTKNMQMFYVLILLQTFHWLEPISSALYSLFLIGILFRYDKTVLSNN